MFVWQARLPSELFLLPCIIFFNEVEFTYHKSSLSKCFLQLPRLPRQDQAALSSPVYSKHHVTLKQPLPLPSLSHSLATTTSKIGYSGYVYTQKSSAALCVCLSGEHTHSGRCSNLTVLSFNQSFVHLLFSLFPLLLRSQAGLISCLF